MYACSLGDVRVLFLEKGESRHATALPGARSRFEGPIGSFSIYVCGLGDEWALFLKKKSLTPAYGLRRAKVGFGTDGGFFYVRLWFR